jgi:putative ABC transport system substrate-binding protein
MMTFLNGCDNQAHHGRTYKIGILCGHDAFADLAVGFKAKLNELGYIEGQNTSYELHRVSSGHEEIGQAIRTLITDKVDLLFTFTTEASLRAKELTHGTGIPIVFAMAGIEGNNLVDSIPHPGGNITGVRFNGPDQAAKRLDLLLELSPQIKRIWAAYDINYPTNKTVLKALRPAAEAAKVALIEAMVTTPVQIQDELKAQVVSGVPAIDAILIMPDAVTQSPDGWAFIKKFSSDYRIPIAGSAANQIFNGAVFTYTPDYKEMGGQAALMADKIFKGTPAGTIMVKTPPLRLQLNYRRIQELGLTVPEGMLSRADKVIR